MGRKKRSDDDASLDEQIGARVAKLRQDRGWSQAKLGKLVKLSAAQISDLEAGNHGFSAALLFRVGQSLGISIHSLLTAEVADPDALPALQRIFDSLQRRDQAIVMDLTRKLAYWPEAAFQPPARSQNAPPLLISLEGIDGALLSMIGRALAATGMAGRTVKFYESDYTSPLWNYMIPRFRAIEQSSEPRERRAMERTLLFAYERLLRQDSQIRPALEQGHIVAAPFFAMAAEVYQEVEGSADNRIIDAVVETSLRKADLIVLVRSNPEDAVRRATPEVPQPGQFFSQYSHYADFASAMQRYTQVCDAFQARNFNVLKTSLDSTDGAAIDRCVATIVDRCINILHK